MRKRAWRKDIYLQRWAIHSHQLQFKLTIRRPKPSSTTEYSQNAQKRWICASTGYETDKHNNNLEYTGGQEHKTGGIIGRNIIRPPITSG